MIFKLNLNIFFKPEKIDPSLAGEGYSIKADIWSLGISMVSIKFFNLKKKVV